MRGAILELPQYGFTAWCSVRKKNTGTLPYVLPYYHISLTSVLILLCNLRLYCTAHTKYTCIRYRRILCSIPVFVRGLNLACKYEVGDRAAVAPCEMEAAAFIPEAGGRVGAPCQTLMSSSAPILTLKKLLDTLGVLESTRRWE
jgi:hypothetical protein